MTGLNLAHYHIDAELGRGGMGIVYRATDTKLDRTVAVKVLPPHALASPDDRARFFREAKAAAQLSHPNVCHVYQVDEAVLEQEGSEPGPDAEKRPFIVMEYVDGESLAARIAKGPLKLEEAVRIAGEVAEALGAAHDAGVIHRDVKSGNVMLTTKGVAKVLDFGLAKTAASTQLTRQGSTLGTIAYMSPEQARGEEVDRRTDLWALGVVLYEMIAGRLPFSADYDQAALYAILNEDPEPLTALRTGVPMGLEWIVSKLLAKRPGDRYQGTADLLVDLRTVDLASPSMSRVSRTSAPAMPALPPAAPVNHFRRNALVATGAVILVLAGILLGRAGSKSNGDEPGSVRRFELITLETGRSSPWTAFPEDLATLSPDGREIVLERGDRLWVRPLGSLDFEEVPGTQGAIDQPGWTGDSRYVFFLTRGAGGQFMVRRLDRPSGAIQDFATLPGGAGYGTFTADGSFLTIGSRIYGPLSSAGPPVALTDSIPGLSAFFPLEGAKQFIVAVTYSTAAKRILFLSGRDTSELMRLPSEQAVSSIEGDGSGTILVTIYDSSGRRSAIWVMEIDPESGEVTREPSVLVNDAAAPSLATDGALLYHTSVPPDSTELVRIDRKTLASRRVGAPLSYITAPSVSTDGRRVAVRADIGNTQDTWVFEPERNTQGRLTSGIPHTWRAAWSPDDRFIAFQSRRPEDHFNGDIYVQETDGLSEARLVKGGGDNDWFPAVTPDGRSVVYAHRSAADAQTRFEMAPIDGSAAPQIVFDPPYAVGAAAFSPDGRWLAFNGNRDEMWNIFIAPWPTLDAVYQVSSGAGEYPVWAGNEIFYLGSEGSLWAVEVTGSSPPRFGQPVRVLSSTEAGTDLRASNTFNVGVSPDGQSFYVARPLGRPTPTRLIYVENWKSLLD